MTQFGEALDDGPGSPGRATLYTGPRGVGKTALLNAVEDEAREKGWLVISEDASAGLVDRLVAEHLPRLLHKHNPKATKRRLSGVSAPGGLGAVNWDTTEEHPSRNGFRTQIEQLLDLLVPHETGLLITVDEVIPEAIADLTVIGTVLQHAFREERDLAFVGAGLPTNIAKLIEAPGLKFMQRADTHPLGSVSDEDVEDGLRVPITDAGRIIPSDLLERAVAATAGYPFLIQLVGANIWRLHPEVKQITDKDVVVGIAAARRRLGSLVHAPLLRDLSAIDKSFLLAMSQDDAVSRIADIAKRMGCDTNYAGQYRLRLVNTQIIAPVGRGKLDFAVPYLREYLREHAASIGAVALATN